MARIGGVNIPDKKHVVIALTYIYGIGKSTAIEICSNCSVDCMLKVCDLTEQQLEDIRKAVGKYTIEGDKRREVSLNIKRLVDIKSFRGIRHRRGLPARGQRTKTNARTRKGPRKSIRA